MRNLLNGMLWLQMLSASGQARRGRPASEWQVVWLTALTVMRRTENSLRCYQYAYIHIATCIGSRVDATASRPQ